MIEQQLTVEIRRTGIWLYPYEISTYSRKLKKVFGTCPDLDRTVSIYNFKTHRYYIPLDIYDDKLKIMKIPRGYGIDKIESILDKNRLRYQIKDNSSVYIRPRRDLRIKMSEKYKPRDKWQEQSISFLLNESSNIERLPQKLLTLDTGFGKTYCAINYISQADRPALIISSNLSEQWADDILEYTNVNPNEICFIKGADSIKKVMKKKNHRECFYLASTRTLISVMKSYGVEILDEFINLTGIGIKIFDEIHSQISANMFIDVNSSVESTVYLTATPGRSKKEENEIFQRLFRKIDAFGYQTHFIKTYYNIRLIDYDTRANQYHNASCMTSNGFSGFKYYEYIFGSNSRKFYIFSMMKIFADKILSSDKDAKILIFLPGLEHIETFINLFEKTGTDCVGNYTSAVSDKDDKKEELRANIIFTTLGSGSTGLDLSNLRAVFLFSPFSSHILSRQVLGRLRYIPGKSVYLYDFIDRSFPHMDFQREKRMSVFGPRANKIETMFCSFNDVRQEMNDRYKIEI